MAKKVVLNSGVVFDTLKAAKEYFAKIRETVAVGEYLSEPELTEVIEIYMRYCAATAWTPVNALRVTACFDEKQRLGGGFARSKALAVVDASGVRTIFSVDRALEAIAG